MKLIYYQKNKNFGDALNPYIFNKLIPNFFDEDPSSIFLGIGSILQFNFSEVKRFYQYFVREKIISDSPMVNIAQPKAGQSLPKTLSEAEVEALLSAPNIEEPMGLRDKAMLELLYATGLRVTELVGLRMEQINLRQAVVFVKGKGNKERLVPLGEEAMYWLEQFLKLGRAQMIKHALVLWHQITQFSVG